MANDCVDASLHATPCSHGDHGTDRHEEHFARVTEQYLDHLVEGQLPEWERDNLLTKYYLTTQAYEKSR